MNLPSLAVQQNCRQEGDKLNSHTALETTFRFVISNCDAAAAVFVCCAHSRLPVIKINRSIPKRVLGIFFFSHHSATLLSEDSSFLTLSYLWALQCFYISGVCSRGGHEYWWSKGALSACHRELHKRMDELLGRSPCNCMYCEPNASRMRHGSLLLCLITEWLLEANSFTNPCLKRGNN